MANLLVDPSAEGELKVDKQFTALYGEKPKYKSTWQLQKEYYYYYAHTIIFMWAVLVILHAIKPMLGVCELSIDQMINDLEDRKAFAEHAASAANAAGATWRDDVYLAFPFTNGTGAELLQADNDLLVDLKAQKAAGNGFFLHVDTITQYCIMDKGMLYAIVAWFWVGLFEFVGLRKKPIMEKVPWGTTAWWAIGYGIVYGWRNYYFLQYGDYLGTFDDWYLSILYLTLPTLLYSIATHYQKDAFGTERRICCAHDLMAPFRDFICIWFGYKHPMLFYQFIFVFAKFVLSINIYQIFANQCGFVYIPNLQMAFANIYGPMLANPSTQMVGYFVRTFLEMSISFMFFSVYLPVGGKIVCNCWSQFFRLCGKYQLGLLEKRLKDAEESGDLLELKKAERDMGFITTQFSAFLYATRAAFALYLDLFRFAFGRSILLKFSYLSFVLMLLKDFTFHVFHYGVKAHSAMVCLNLKRSHKAVCNSELRTLKSRWTTLLKVLEQADVLLRIPRILGTAFNITLDVRAHEEMVEDANGQETYTVTHEDVEREIAKYKETEALNNPDALNQDADIENQAASSAALAKRAKGEAGVADRPLADTQIERMRSQVGQTVRTSRKTSLKIDSVSQVAYSETNMVGAGMAALGGGSVDENGVKDYPVMMKFGDVAFWLYNFQKLEWHKIDAKGGLDVKGQYVETVNNEDSEDEVEADEAFMKSTALLTRVDHKAKGTAPEEAQKQQVVAGNLLTTLYRGARLQDNSRKEKPAKSGGLFDLKSLGLPVTDAEIRAMKEFIDLYRCENFTRYSCRSLVKLASFVGIFMTTFTENLLNLEYTRKVGFPSEFGVPKTAPGNPSPALSSAWYMPFVLWLIADLAEHFICIWNFHLGDGNMAHRRRCLSLWARSFSFAGMNPVKNFTRYTICSNIVTPTPDLGSKLKWWWVKFCISPMMIWTLSWIALWFYFAHLVPRDSWNAWVLNGDVASQLGSADGAWAPQYAGNTTLLHSLFVGPIGYDHMLRACPPSGWVDWMPAGWAGYKAANGL